MPLMKEVAQRYAAIAEEHLRTQGGCDRVRAAVQSCAPRFCVIRFDNVDNPDDIGRNVRGLAMALGRHESVVRFGYPLNDEPHTAFLEAPLDDFVSQPLHEMLDEMTAYQEAIALFQNTTIPLGLGVAPVILDLKEDAHVLIAGSTGSGKSVLLRSMVNYILTFLWNTSLYIIDPKGVEFAAYTTQKEARPEDVSVKDTQLMERISGAGQHAQTIKLLERLVDLMDRRFARYARADARDIDGYRQIIGPRPFFFTKHAALAHQRLMIELKEHFGDRQGQIDCDLAPCASVAGRTFTDRIIVVIDEIADLFVSASKEERERLVTALLRIAQKGRAAGIHLILATQRPSTEVIPGILKANVTARIALRCASTTDSQSILGTGDAAALAGAGDALFYNGVLRRFQAPMTDEDDFNYARCARLLGYPIGWFAYNRRAILRQGSIRELESRAVDESPLVEQHRALQAEKAAQPGERAAQVAP